MALSKRVQKATPDSTLSNDMPNSNRLNKQILASLISFASIRGAELRVLVVVFVAKVASIIRK